MKHGLGGSRRYNFPMADTLSRARRWALAAHGDQRYGDLPYSVHLEAVAELLVDYGVTAQSIGYLHDVVEDTPRTRDDVAREFGELIADCTALCTDVPGATRRERKAATHAKLAQVRGELELALVVKAADRLANVRACVRGGRADKLAMYRREHPEFRQAARREGLADELWAELDALL